MPNADCEDEEGDGESCIRASIEIEATDKGSTVDIQSWASKIGHQYIGTKHEGDLLMHYVRKANEHEMNEVVKYPHTVTNAELEDIIKW